MTSIVAIWLVALWAVVVGESWLLYRVLRGQSQIVLDHTHIQNELQKIESALVGPHAPTGHQAPPSLEIGTRGPEIRLPDLSGRERHLDEFLGRPLVVSFFSPTCSFCRELAPRLGQVSENGPRLLVISRGEVDENLRLAKDHKWRCDVLLDSAGQVTAAYQVGGTPTGYLLDAQGRVASELAVGADAVLALLATKVEDHGALTAEVLQEKVRGAARRVRQAGLSLTNSRLNRQGLKPGVNAPEFALPDLSGETRSLTSFLDKRVLLVFSDPHCGPCEALAPQLADLHQRYLGDSLRVVMISRGDLDVNREKAVKHGLPFPVLLQKHWEISKEYAMFATPIGYLINQKGRIAKPVAVGAKAILELVEPS